jgi:hypothetical protein
MNSWAGAHRYGVDCHHPRTEFTAQNGFVVITIIWRDVAVDALGVPCTGQFHKNK